MCFGQILTVFSLIFQKHFSLTLHKRTHVDKSKLDFQCHMCEYASYSKRNLRGHIQLKHSDKTKYKHVCEYCGEKFLYPHLLEAHHVIIPLLFKSQSKSESKGWCIKFICDWAKYRNGHSSKSIQVIKLSFCQNDSREGGSFWRKDSLITIILFELCLFMIFSPVANLMHHPLGFEIK